MALIGTCPQAESNNCPSNRRAPPRLVRTLDDSQVLAMLAAPDVSTFIGYRDSVVMRTLWETGLRASELIGLGLGDVLADALYVARGKGGRSRWMPISDEAPRLLQGYMELRSTTRPGKHAALWVTHRGQALRSRRSVWAIVSHWHARHSVARWATRIFAVPRADGRGAVSTSPAARQHGHHPAPPSLPAHRHRADAGSHQPGQHGALSDDAHRS